MGRHSRRDPADTTDNTSTSGTPLPRDVSPGATPGTGRRRRAAENAAPHDGTPAHGTPAHGTPAHGTPAHGTPAHRTPAHGTPAHGTPAHGTPAHGTPVDGAAPRPTPPHGVPHVRGGHPEQREPGGGWGDVPGTGGGPQVRGQHSVPGPRQDYVAAFPDGEGAADEPEPGPEPDGARPPRPRDPYASVTDWAAVPEPRSGGRGGDFFDGDGDGDDGEASGDGKKHGRGRVIAVAAAAATATVLAVVMAGQLAGGGKESGVRTKAAPGGARDTDDPASRSDRRPTPAEAPNEAPATYEEKMAEERPLDAKLKASGDFEAMPGFEKAPGKGQLFRYRVDVEKGLGLDGRLFAQAVQKTLNDDRSWAHAGARTFERISSGKPDFVVTLASPGTTAAWCAKSGLDTTQDNVSCDSAATERVMINAYRWAQGAKTYGDAVKKKYGSAIFPYRQMLINHEVGHRLGFNHTDCTKDGSLAPVMQQQTKFLEHDGIKCRANPWAFPKS
ncbi:DUF3152 domain-containing protein [Streptomyces sp. NPDC093510]|uniref:DUF3152 domain-containing protein n=1 Tax=Streptomyces sp. NPDC093510 TaxID=3155199 RepID=UPI0034295183